MPESGAGQFALETHLLSVYCLPEREDRLYTQNTCLRLRYTSLFVGYRLQGRIATGVCCQYWPVQHRG